jgi:hypothetical protein
MPRRREVPKREILADPIYNSQLVTKFVNVLMMDGKKAVAERILYDALGSSLTDQPQKTPRPKPSKPAAPSLPIIRESITPDSPASP